MRVLHIITSLSTGGAEMMLEKLLGQLDPRTYVPTVVSLTSKHPVGDRLEATGVEVRHLDARGGVLFPHHFRRLKQIYRATKPDIIHTWMYHSNLAGHWLRRRGGIVPKPALITSVRGAAHAPRSQGVALRVVRRIDAALSHNADAVVFNSQRSADQHVALGYSQARIKLIANGFDLSHWHEDREGRLSVREQLGVGDQLLVGLVARFNPLKGHRFFLEAAQRALRSIPTLQFLLVGKGCDANNETLRSWINELGLRDRVLLLGERNDMRAVNNALDISVCASISESFPNAIGESMACAVPCIVTDVGDCDRLLGDRNWVVPPHDATALGSAIVRLSSLDAGERRALGQAAALRIAQQFSIQAIAGQFAELYESVRLRA